MQEIRFFPLGNADTTLITLEGNRHILWDYANMKCADDKDDKRCDLPEELNSLVKNDFEVVVFTHADKDHFKGFSDYFYLEHNNGFQQGDRKKIQELWVPAAVLLESELEEDEAKILQREAKYRLRNGAGVRVFSRPKAMKDWCDRQSDISYESVKHLFVDAGSVIDKYSLANDGIEIFVHSPFLSESKNIDRNKASIVVQITFKDFCNTKLILGGDCTHEVWRDIATVTKYKNNEDRLRWDIFHLSHHCSYLSLSSDKGNNKTEPIDEIKWLFEDMSNQKFRIVSPSKPIPTPGSKEDQDSQPPHRQAAAYYKSVMKEKNGDFLVTMSEPTEKSPRTIKVEIGFSTCAVFKKPAASSAAYIGSQNSPRAGKG